MSSNLTKQIFSEKWCIFFIPSILMIVSESHSTIAQTTNGIDMDVIIPVAPELLLPNPNQRRIIQPGPVVPTQPFDVISVPPILHEGNEITIKEIKVVGNTKITSSEIQSIIRPYELKELSLKNLQTVSNEIKNLYIDEGLSATVVVSKVTRVDTLIDYIAEINITEETEVTEDSLNSDGNIFPVTDIRIEGSTILSTDQKVLFTKDSVGKDLQIRDIRKIANEITQHYFNENYVTSVAVMDEFNLETSSVSIKVFEDRLAPQNIDIKIKLKEDPKIKLKEDPKIKLKEDSKIKLKESFIKKRVMVGLGVPLNIKKLEQNIQLLKEQTIFDLPFPILTIEDVRLRGTTKLGERQLEIMIKEGKPIYTSPFITNNFTSPNIASQTGGIRFDYRNLSGNGDGLSATYLGGLNFGDLNNAAFNSYALKYAIPLNARNGKLELEGSFRNFSIVSKELKALGIRGEGPEARISFSQPIVQRRRKNFSEDLSLGANFIYQHSQTFNNLGPAALNIGPDANGVSSTSVVSISQNYRLKKTKSESQKTESQKTESQKTKSQKSIQWEINSQLNFGLPILGATSNTGKLPDGNFFSWNPSIKRDQNFGNDFKLIISGDLQLTPDTLLGSQQFGLSGPQKVRGYRNGIRGGDNGYRVSIEGQVPLKTRCLIKVEDPSDYKKTICVKYIPSLIFSPFVDMGQVWNNSGNPNQQPERRFLAGGGLGITWNPIDTFNARLDFGVPFINLADSGSDIQDNGIYFQFGGSFQF